VTRIVFLVPRREDHGWRDRLWTVARARWERLFPDWPVVEGHHTDGPWNRASAVNTAAAQAGDWDIGIVIDADVMVDRDQVAAAVETAQRTGRVTWAHRGWRELTEDATKTYLGNPGLLMKPTLTIPQAHIRKENPISWSCCMVVPRKAWDALGGMDERFRGWGGEDTAFAAAVQGLLGHERIEGFVWNLWHPRSPGDGRPAPTPEYVTNMRLRDRYAFALRRDHWLHDRAHEASEKEHRRDMANIERAETQHRTRQVCYCGECARRLGLPDWSRWWPTLDELVARTAPVPEVALIVQSGGAPETWPQRSAFLRATLASLNEHLVLPKWERRVIWSDWGDLFRQELEDIAAEHGFYLPPRLTSERRRGYTASMQAKWRYMATIVKAPWVFLSEDDFTLDRDVDVAAMVEAMDRNPHLVQMALLRDAHDGERERGGILGHPKDAFTRTDTHLEHARFFTANPSLVRRSIAFEPWPDGHNSESVFGRRVFGRDKRARAAFWGHGEQWVTHLGWDARAGGPY
jgi:hypothetical protein